MKSLSVALVFLMLSIFAIACGGSESEHDPLPEVEASSEALMSEVAFGPCAPGPSSNFCVNVEGDPCSTSWRRCYDPVYCEWHVCMCVGGAWDCENF